jgi:hypothetical protein
VDEPKVVRVLRTGKDRDAHIALTLLFDDRADMIGERCCDELGHFAFAVMT